MFDRIILQLRKAWIIFTLKLIGVRIRYLEWKLRRLNQAQIRHESEEFMNGDPDE